MKTIIKIIAAVFLIGGVMGLVKGVFPQLEWLSFRSLLGASSADHGASMMRIERIYGLVMAALEVLMAVLLLISVTKYFKLAVVVVGLNALGCAVALIMGDMFAIVSLLLRIVVIVLLIGAIRRDNANSQPGTGAVKAVKP